MSERDGGELFKKIDIGVRKGIAQTIAENKKAELSVLQINDKTGKSMGEAYCVYQVQFFDLAVIIQGSVQQFDTYQASQEYIEQQKNIGLPYPWVIVKRAAAGQCELLDIQK